MITKKKNTPAKKKKTFDAVKMMRDIRDKMDRDMAGMTFEEEKAYIKKRIAEGAK